MSEAGNGRRSLRPGLVLLGIAATALSAGSVSLGLGIYCYTQPSPGVDCAALTAVGPLVTIPLTAATGILGAARLGWLVRRGEEEGTAASDDPPPTAAIENPLSTAAGVPFALGAAQDERRRNG